MKSKEFIFEDEQADIVAIQVEYELTEQDVKFALAVKAKCKPFLQDVDFRAFSEFGLFRGIKDDNDYLTKVVRLDGRQPKDTAEGLHNKLNAFYTAEFGAAFRNAIFCTGDYAKAQDYGNAYNIFPIGDFRSLWSPDINDLWVEHSTFRRNFAKNGRRIMDYINDAEDSFIENVIAKADWKTNELKNGIKYKNEIMIRCKQYFACRVDSDKEKGLEAIIRL